MNHQHRVLAGGTALLALAAVGHSQANLQQVDRPYVIVEARVVSAGDLVTLGAGGISVAPSFLKLGFVPSSSPTTHGSGPAKDPVIVIDPTGIQLGNHSGPHTHGPAFADPPFILIDPVDLSLVPPQLGTDTLGGATGGGGGGAGAGAGSSPTGVQDPIIVIDNLGPLLGNHSGPHTHGPQAADPLIVIDIVGLQLGNHSGPHTHGPQGVDAPVVIDIVGPLLANHSGPHTHAPQPADDPQFPYDPPLLPAGVTPTPATVEVFNGTGLNPVIYKQATPAIVGQRWNTTVELGQFKYATFSFVAVSLQPGATRLSMGELLIDARPTQIAILDIGVGQHSIPVPAERSLIGVQLYTQAAVAFLDGGFGSPSLQLTNALDVTVGDS